MSKRRGSRRSRTMKRRIKYHGGRKRTRLGRKRGGGRKRKSRRIKRGGMKEAVDRSKKEAAAQVQYNWGDEIDGQPVKLEDLMGLKVRVYWKQEDWKGPWASEFETEWFRGTVTKVNVNDGTVEVEYAGGVIETTKPTNDTFHLLEKPGSTK